MRFILDDILRLKKNFAVRVIHKLLVAKTHLVTFTVALCIVENWLKWNQLPTHHADVILRKRSRLKDFFTEETGWDTYWWTKSQMENHLQNSVISNMNDSFFNHIKARIVMRQIFRGLFDFVVVRFLVYLALQIGGDCIQDFLSSVKRLYPMFAPPGNV